MKPFMKAKKWKYKLNDNSDEAEVSEGYQPQIFITPQASGGMSQQQASLRVVENTIFFYGEVNDSTCLDLNAILIDLDAKIWNTFAFIDSATKPHIKLRIKSDGGEIFSALSTIDVIRNLKCDVYTYVDGCAASAATLLSICGKKRFIGKNAFMLIHQLSAGSAGKFKELEDSFENCKVVMKLLKDIYKQYTKINMKTLNEILDHDLWMDASTCLNYGLVDEII
jgi:ATP-dependent Clp endopeptidase proteolytic subunit ClpP